MTFIQDCLRGTAGGVGGLSRPECECVNPRRLRVRLEGLKVYHSLEAPKPDIGKQHRTLGIAASAARPQGWARPVSVTAAVREESEPFGNVSEASSFTSALRLRIPP